MITINFFGQTDDFIFDAFGDIEVTSFTGTRVVVRDFNSGFVTTITGSGFAQDASASSGFRGTVTGFTTQTAGGAQVLALTGLSTSADTFDAAVSDATEGDLSRLAALLSTDDITFDGTASERGTELQDLLRQVTSDITLTGTPFEDRLGGGLGNDLIRTGGTTRFEGDFIIGSGGSDRIDFTGAGAETFVEMVYNRAPGPVTFTVNGAANTGSIAKSGQGTDTLINPAAVLGWGLTLTGSANDDTYTVNGGAGSFMSVVGDQGNDTFNITTTGTVRIDYRYSWQQDPQTGIVVDLSTGVVSNDGHGGRDRINVTDGGSQIELRGTRLADSIRGSDADERFILLEGNDTLDAGGGFDTLRYNRGGVETGINANLDTGRITGTWDGQAFVHTVSGIEEIRGSNNGNDTIVGSAADERLFGNGGNDSLMGGDGTDLLDGWEGNDYLNPGDNTDFDNINPHSGMDTVDLGDILRGYAQVHHFGLANSGGQTIAIDGTANTGSVNKGANGTTTILDVQGAMQADGLGIVASNGNDTINVTGVAGGFVQIAGGRGNDSYVIGASEGAVRIDLRSDAQFNDATQGAVVDLAAGVIRNDGFGFSDTVTRAGDAPLEIRGTDLADRFLGSDGDERFIGRGGNDTVDGGGGIDQVRYDRGGSSTGIEAHLKTGTVKGAWEGAAFTHRLANIEDLRGTDFADSISGDLGANVILGQSGADFLYGDGIQANLTGAAAGQVYRMYQATLDRAPDAGGYEGWVTSLYEGRVGLADFPNGFVRSPEFTQTYGALDDAGFVNLLYRNVLDRDADAGGLRGWLDFIADGGTRAGVVLGFSESAEFKQNTAQASADFALSQSEAHWTDEIYRVYRATLDRDPDLGGFTGWAELLGSGTAFETMIDGFVRSPEFNQTYGALDDTGFIELLYQNVLDRGADAGGLQGWLDFLDGGGTRAGVVRGFAQSAEFQRDTASDLTAWVKAQGRQDDLYVADGPNTLMGGILKDRFVFDAGDTGASTVVDFETWDTLRMNGFGYGDFDTFATHLTQAGTNLVFADQGVTVTLQNTLLSDLAIDQVELF